MNYRHAYHAGNFADVMKHASLALLLDRLCAKPRPLTVIDSHGGRGLYRLDSPEAQRTAEHAAGIGRLTDAWPDLEALAPYRRALSGQPLGTYPGSPLLALALMRPDDRLIAVEKHPEEAEALRRALAGDARTAVHQRDAWEALAALTPPQPRRGLVLVDPPYEQTDEAERMVEAFGRAVPRWPEACWIAWYPLKDEALAWRLLDGLERLARRRSLPLLKAELTVDGRRDWSRLHGSGLAVLNPPWQADLQLAALIEALRPRLAIGPGAEGALAWLVERPAEGPASG